MSNSCLFWILILGSIGGVYIFGVEKTFFGLALIVLLGWLAMKIE